MISQGKVLLGGETIGLKRTGGIVKQGFYSLCLDSFSHTPRIKPPVSVGQERNEYVCDLYGVSQERYGRMDGFDSRTHK